MDRARTAVRSISAPCDRREAHAIGRHARLELAFEERSGRPALAYAYAEPPLRASRVFRSDAWLHMIMATSAPGIFGGDRFEQHITIGRGCRVRLTSQSAVQAHPGSGTADIVSRFDVADEGWLWCEWDPLIPFASAEINQRIEITLAPSARLLWSDALMCGRQGSGERWALRSLSHELSVRRGGRLEYLERYRVEPGRHDPTGVWLAGNAAYVGTVLLSGVPLATGCAEALHRRLSTREGIIAAVEQLEPELLLIRLASPNGAAFHEARGVIKALNLVSGSGPFPLDTQSRDADS
jgi:urease accessory protein UreH